MLITHLKEVAPAAIEDGAEETVSIVQLRYSSDEYTCIIIMIFAH